MWRSIACISEQLEHGLQLADTPSRQCATLGIHPIAGKLLLISHPAESRRLSSPEHTIG